MNQASSETPVTATAPAPAPVLISGNVSVSSSAPHVVSSSLDVPTPAQNLPPPKSVSVASLHPDENEEEVASLQLKLQQKTTSLKRRKAQLDREIRLRKELITIVTTGFAKFGLKIDPDHPDQTNLPRLFDTIHLALANPPQKEKEQKEQKLANNAMIDDIRGFSKRVTELTHHLHEILSKFTEFELAYSISTAPQTRSIEKILSFMLTHLKEAATTGEQWKDKLKTNAVITEAEAEEGEDASTNS